MDTMIDFGRLNASRQYVPVGVLLLLGGKFLNEASGIFTTFAKNRATHQLQIQVATIVRLGWHDLTQIEIRFVAVTGFCATATLQPSA